MNKSLALTFRVFFGGSFGSPFNFVVFFSLFRVLLFFIKRRNKQALSHLHLNPGGPAGALLFSISFLAASPLFRVENGSKNPGLPS